MQTTSSVLVAWYVKHFRSQVRLAKKDPKAWIGATRRFGLQLILVAIALLAVCVFLPDDARRWIFVSLSAVTFLVGVWHRANARAITDAIGLD